MKINFLFFGVFVLMTTLVSAKETCGLKSYRGGVFRTVGVKLYDKALITNPESLDQYVAKELVQSGGCYFKPRVCEVVEASNQTVLTGPEYANIKVGHHTFTLAPFFVEDAILLVQRLKQSGICR